MALTAGTRLGPYEIVAAIGAGGMGEVYRATDSNLKRSVAIKVLPASVAGDADRLARFQREAEVLAALNHPNIAAIYGLEKTADLTALVMELVDGEDLSQIIARGPIPISDVLPIARQIADALEAAHEHGIVHRDLKPANIKIKGARGPTPTRLSDGRLAPTHSASDITDGMVKVLDFGLAKALGPDGASASAGPSPSLATMTSPAMTAMGMILGTAAYMSPEQAKGRVVDKRADIWAFGVVLYEMLTGRRAFQGDDVSDLLVAVLSKDVDLTALPAGTPRSIVTLIQRCLVRDPKQRLRDIGDARFALDERAEPGAGASDSASPRVVNRTPERFAWAALVIVAAVLTPLTMKWFAAAAPEPVVSRFELPLPVKASLFNRLEISPDGRQIAVVVAGDDGINRISIRPMDATMFRVLPGTEDASYPFWSPDSRSIAFFSHDTLKKIAVAGGPPTTLCPALRGRGGTWNSAGVVLFSSSINNAEHLQQVAEGGGTPALVASLALGGTSSIQRWPHFLPDGRHFLFFASARKAETDGVYVGSFGETGATRLVEGFTEARYSDGMLFFVRDTTLLAQPFDAVRRVLGPADPVVVSSVSPGGNEGAQAFSVSEGGTLVARPMAVASEFQLKWFDRGGRWVADLGVPASQLGPRISRDGLRVVTPTVPVLGRPGGGALWTTDVKSGRSQRLTFVDGGYGTAVWSPDATAVFFGMGTGATGISDLFRQPTNGGASQEALLVDRAHKNPVDVSLDGRYLAYVRAPTQSTTEVWVLSLADRKPSLYVKQGARARLSPVGGWAAYAGNESGRFEIFLQSFPTPGTKFQITTGGGDAPVWSRDGREIFYHAGGKLMAVSVSMTAGTPTIGQATTLFNLPVNLQGSNDYDVSPDGRFLFAVPVENQTPTALVTLNWKAGLKK